MDIDETECQDSGGENRIEVARRLPVECGQAIDQIGQVFRLRAYVVRERLLGVPSTFADESAFGPETELHEARIADHDALQALQFVDVERGLTGLPDRVAPALDAILRRLLTLYGKARSRVAEQQERSRARQHVTRYCRHDVACAGRQVQRDELVQPFGAVHQRAEARCAGEVVLDAVARGILGGGRELQFGVHDRWISTSVGVRQVEPPSGEPLVQEPDTPCVSAGGRGSHSRLDRCGTGGKE